MSSSGLGAKKTQEHPTALRVLLLSTLCHYFSEQRAVAHARGGGQRRGSGGDGCY